MSIRYSIIIPVYNTEKYVEHCIKSVVEQIGTEDEIIIINDGSTDSSEIIIDQYRKRYPQIQYFFQKNQGLSDARNKGLNRATGDYVIWLDSDDILCTEALKKLSEYTRKNPDVILNQISTVSYENGVYEPCEWRFEKCVEYDAKLYSQEKAIKKILKTKKMWYAAPVFVVKRSFVIENKLYFEKGLLHEDELWTAVLIATARSFMFNDNKFYLCTSHRVGSIINSKNIKKAFDKLEIVSRMAKLKKNNDNQPVNALYRRRIMLLLCGIDREMKNYETEPEYQMLKVKYDNTMRKTYHLMEPLIRLIFTSGKVIYDGKRLSERKIESISGRIFKKDKI